MSDPGWCKAMALEIEALEANGTWDMKPLPPNKKALGCKWIADLDYHETFAPIAKVVSVRDFLAVVATRNWELHQMNVHNVFLHGDLDEEVYMKLPPVFYVGRKGLVCRLRKSLYGLCQAPRCWFAKLVASLLSYGFSQSYSDYSLFTLKKGTIELYVLVYVDDLIIAGIVLPLLPLSINTWDIAFT
ncbi:transmembrane signal receptor [Lithospermum erythrorhizon]|uniref:Transmembrane signal receptor n=1 Tax=Lithospermum erythrorhizon TaxID=34254 RepID=A0AAV3QSQ9_LITER